ncbi:PREDICTED: autophagy-related protein 13b-like isoform X2 [Nelumbo nucifera]|uniref:Autophagy-related protein 13b-like isoform X2 n=1 Tax=Nelumbo nucifera TaxID=4432 RepID=A0A1U8AF00_NELNU|nr:PREDICTED: autophagy-related protein 13b-like isoform X2 [Nelumbo nucifera]
MASSQSNCHSESEKIEQIINEFFTKSLHIILESRSPSISSRYCSGKQALLSPSSSPSSSSTVKPRDKWFNLALRACPSALENIDLRRQSNLEPMVVDVILVQRPMGWDPIRCSPMRCLTRNHSFKERLPYCRNPGQEEFGSEGKRERIIERWIVQYESRMNKDSSAWSKRAGSTSTHSLYKKSIILLRSLYLTLRLLPAYKLFKELSSSGQFHTFSLEQSVRSFVEPFTRTEEADMQQLGFMPIDTNGGRLCTSVLYYPTLLDINSEPSIPISPKLIPDYVGNPTTNPLKRFSSLPSAGLVSQGSPSSSPCSRRHSWSCDHYGASASSLLPSPTNSGSCVIPSGVSTNHHQPANPSHHSSNTSLVVHKKNRSFKEYLSSSTLSLSPPSPPTNVPDVYQLKALLPRESAPAGVPAVKIVENTLSDSHMLPLSPSSKGTMPGCSQIDNVKTPVRSGDIQTCITALKVYSGRSSRLSFQDEFNGSDFSCPFAVDDNDNAIMGPHTRSESFDGKRLLSELLEPGELPIRKSQEAILGSLVNMLKTAPSLHRHPTSFKLQHVPKPQNQRKSTRNAKETSNLEVREVQNAASCPGFTPSRLLVSKTAADALKELQSYREIKELLLRQGIRSLTLANDAPGAQPVSRGAKGF